MSFVVFFQVKHKPEPIRKLWDHDGDPVFGVHHYYPHKAEQMLTRAKEVQQAQMDAAEQRNKRLQQSRTQQIEQEKAILRRVHHDSTTVAEQRCNHTNVRTSEVALHFLIICRYQVLTLVDGLLVWSMAGIHS
ncbi:hypothetical protein AHF37_11733 [Paragonimus kellicotti]|nr:hypothetical protein AHF37_11733 [Paragonimus kellicotti]